MSSHCACGHSRSVHINGRRRCEVRGCQCLILRIRELLPAAEPPPRGRATVDASGLVVAYEKPQLTPAQRILRQSDAKKLENRLARKIEIAGLPAPVREYHWAKPERLFRADFAWPAQRVLAEVQGGIWARNPGDHNRGSGYEEDCARNNLAQLLGWRVLLFTERMIGGEHQLESPAVQTLRRALQPAEKLL